MAIVKEINWRPRGIADLEPNAWEAIRRHGNTCVVAGPGAGKTEFLAQRAAYLLETGICPKPYRILAISFKTDAAQNLSKRVRCKKTGDDDTQFSFERDDPHILIRAGSSREMFLECMLLEFSFFHEYLSHAFPTWSKDHAEISEGFLFALEFEWLQSKYTLFDNDLVLQVWQPRLNKEREAFRTGQWLFQLWVRS